MPIPNPNAGEKQNSFIARCYTQLKDEYDRAKALAICYRTYKDKK